MGQRLNVEIHKNGEPLANAYYHWSGYTDSALNITSDIIYCVSNGKLASFIDPYWSCIDPIRAAILILESTGAGISEEEREYINQEYQEKFKNALLDLCLKPIDRNQGLISISEKGMEITRKWEEGRVTIDIERRTVNFDVFFYMTENEYVREEYSDVPYKDLPVLNMDPFDIPFDRFYEFAEFVGNCGTFLSHDGAVLMCIH